ncbi:hypothetical protein BGZ60DRAFT_493505 [Tricladium varicosporioides]|nr:hypothetical protein BGZ60DRAFT_493505 [Hymenoscyphus varicosporioides]
MSHTNEEYESLPEVDTPSAWKQVWLNNRGVIYITAAEAVGSSMDAIVRFLQQGGHRMHTLQLVFARMSMTFIISMLYMWWTNVPDFPLGKKSVRGWLILRALFGFFGLFCLYYSVRYLPLAENTVIRFLVPLVTSWSCYTFLSQPFSTKERLAGIAALVGVIFIAHPSSIFGPVDADANNIATTLAGAVDDVTPAQRLLAITASLLGVFGAAGAYTTIRIVGHEAHALISVTYFSTLATVGSALALIFVPGISFTLPHGPREWILLLLLGVLGFVLQFLLTTGLQMDKSSRATSMLYTQVLFALGFDWAIWGALPDVWSMFGGGIVVASTLWSALQKVEVPIKTDEGAKTVDEETALLGTQKQDMDVEVSGRRASVGAAE